MRKTKAVSLLLSLALLASLAVPGTLALSAQAEGEQGNSGMVISKNATANVDGTYTITLEAYATGNKIITETKKDIPTDIVLVLDQSGSMADPMSSERAYSAYENRSNRYLYGERFNSGYDNLYYPVDGGYVEVQVDRQYVNGYEPFGTDTSNSTYYDRDNRNALYIKDANGEYQKVTVERSSNYQNYIYTYFVNGQQIAQSSGRNNSPDFGTYGPIYRAGQLREYTYYYQLAGQERVVIETSIGEDTVPGKTYYQYGTVSTSRLDALVSAVSTFANSISSKAAGKDGELGTPDDVNHRVAVVGYAYGGQGYDNDPPYTNTEVFIGSAQHGYGTSAQSVYGSAFQNMDTAAGQANVAASIGALTANGATYTDLGVEMANGILNANPVENGEKRNRVVIVFTDGAPGWSGYESGVASDAISEAGNAKNAGTTVYSVGIFNGADATSAGSSNGTETQRANWFMQQLSSNNGTPQSPSYYLSASDAGTLSSIFQQISDQIEQGGSSTTLSEETVIKDIIAPQFALPEGADASDITLETYSYTGENQWAKNDTAMGATATVNGNMVDVTGFNFAENYVGTVTENGNVTYRGDKLVISFDVETKAGFLGGNNVYTNTRAGVYENGTAESPVMEFERPQVNVPIKDVTVTAENKNVYLLNGLTAEQIRSGATANVGNVTLDLTKPDQNYGLEEWQTSYVDIAVSYADADGNEVTDLSDLTEDTTYQLKVTVSPKPLTEGENLSTEGEEAKKTSGEATGKINVYKPELSYKDSQVYYGADVPTDFSENLTDTKWKHNDTEADTTTMGEAPDLALTYTPDATKIDNGKINTKQDVSVDAEVKIGDTVVTDDTTFLHTDCTGTGCSWDETTLDGTPAFLLHVNTCQLTISKTGGAADEPYVFTVCKDGVKYSEITIVGNASDAIYELPVGIYTIEEDTGWSWRYDANNGGSAELTADTPAGSITCTNTLNKPYWLNGFSSVWKNVCGQTK